MTDIHINDLVDVTRGKMTLKELAKDIAFQMYHRSPEKLVITIERDDTVRGYVSTVYMSTEDFYKFDNKDYR